MAAASLRPEWAAEPADGEPSSSAGSRTCFTAPAAGPGSKPSSAIRPPTEEGTLLPTIFLSSAELATWVPFDKPVSTFAAFLHLTKTNWGVGMMSMPYYMHCAGLWVGLGFFILSMVLTCDCIGRLLRCAHALRGAGMDVNAPYTELVGAALGHRGRSAAFFSIWVGNWGSCVTYAKWLGDNLYAFVPEAGLLRVEWIALVTLPLALGVVFVNDVARLKPISSIGMLMGQGFAVVVVVLTISGQCGAQGQSFMQFLRSEPAFNLSGFPIAMGIAVFCNEGMVLLAPQVEGAMMKPHRFNFALLSMSLYFTFNYMAVAILGIYRFPNPASELSLDFNPPSGVLRVAVLLYAVHLVMSYIIVLFVVYSSVEARAAVTWPEQWAGAQGAPRRALFRLALVLSASGLAAVVPSFGDFIALGGAVGNSLGIYVLPNLCFLALAKEGRLDGVTAMDMVLSKALIIFGTVTGSIAAVVSFQQLIKD